MNRNCFVSRSGTIAARALGDETVVMSAADSTLFTLNEIGTIIWDSADGVTPLEEIVRTKICTQYDVAPDAALQDAEKFVEGLAGHGIFLVSDAPQGQTNEAPVETR